MKKIYIKAFTATNLGDDLFVKVLCERYPQHHFFLECTKEHAAAFCNIPNLTLFDRSAKFGKFHQRVRKYCTKLSHRIGIRMPFAYDAEVYIGGSIFIEFITPAIYNYYFERLYSSKLCKGIPYFILGANFGPYQTKDFLEKHETYFSEQVTDLCFRDKQSYTLFRQLPNVRYAPDILFTLKMPVLPKKELILISCIYDNDREEIGRFDNVSYESKLRELCEYYLSLGKEVCLLSMCDKQGDFQMCENVKNYFPQNVQTINYLGNTEEILRLFAQAEYVIAARFHAVILGWISKTPVFPVYYSNKTLNVIHDYAFQGDYASINDFCNLSCDAIDQNRSSGYIFNSEPLQADAHNHFKHLDRTLNVS